MALTKITGEGVGALDTITIGDGSAADKKILFDGNAQDFHIGLDDSNDSLTIGLGSALGTTSHMVIDANGHVTMPSQPAFLAQPSSTQENLAINVDTTIVFDTERFDQNGDFASNTFTAPVTGKYCLSVSLDVRNLDLDTSNYALKLQTSNRQFRTTLSPNGFDADQSIIPFTKDILVDMDENDTAYVILRPTTGGSAQTDINHSNTHFSGFLVC